MKEVIYFREKLGVNVKSSQIAQSYLDGRVSEDEKFAVAGKSYSFAELLLCDEIIQNTIRVEKKVSLAQTNKFDSFTARYRLFKKIVLRGDDTLAPLLFEIQQQKKRIVELEKAANQTNQQLCSWKKNNNDLLTVCNNAYIAMQDVEKIFSIQQESFSKSSDLSINFSAAIDIAKNVSNSIAEALRTNIIAAVPQESSPQSIITISTQDELRKHTEEKLSQLREVTQLEINAALQQLELYKEQEYQAIEKNKEFLRLIMVLKKIELYKTIQAATEFISEKYIHNKINNAIIFAKRDHRYYSSSPDKFKFDRIQKSIPDITSQAILAFYDCSFAKDGSAGILLTAKSFYFFNAEAVHKYQFHRNNVIFVEKQKKPIRTWCITLGIISFLLANFSFGWYMFGVIFFLIAFYCSPWEAKIKRQHKQIITFSRGNFLEIQAFCNGINNICTRVP